MLERNEQVVNRLCRDELILVALDLIQNANLTHDNAPDGVVQPGCMMLSWLQNIIDYCHHKSPFSITVTSTALDLLALDTRVKLPADFILDVRDAYLVQYLAGDAFSYGRVYRRSFQDFLDQQLGTQRTKPMQYSRPNFYCVVERDRTDNRQYMHVTPTPTNTVYGQLWYYALPPPLEPQEKPGFPSDQIILDYLRIRALEWMGLADIGTSLKFEEKVLAGMKAAGMLNEPERTQVPFDAMNFRKAGWTGNPFSWVGPV